MMKSIGMFLLTMVLALGACPDATAQQPGEGTSGQKEKVLYLDRDKYRERLRGFWLGSCIANWTGLPTENARAGQPFLTDEDWGKAKGHGGAIIDFVLNDHPWKADDDTDIEYVYLYAMEQQETHLLSGQQISKAWRDHVGLPMLWVSNLAALGQLQNGATPPDTSLPENNPMWDMIDAQLTTEVFGALAPGRVDIALQMAHLPIRTTAYAHSEWAAEFYVVMHALVPLVNQSDSRGEQVRWLAERARHRLPEGSYITDMYDFVKADYEANPDKDDWERTRDKLFHEFQIQGASSYQYKYPWDSGINFGASIISLLYGDGDFRRTVQIATLAGWDSDNPTATWGGLLGLLYGHSGLQDYFGKYDFSDDYWIARTRFGFPMETDTITSMANRGLSIIDRVVSKSMGGSIEDNSWRIPVMTTAPPTAHAANMVSNWRSIEDNDPGWRYEGFETRDQQWNASGATLTYGGANCRAEFDFAGTAVQYFAFRNGDSGTATVYLDGRKQAEVNLFNDSSEHGQYYIKVFEKRDLPAGKHTIAIACDGSDKYKTIDLLSIENP